MPAKHWKNQYNLLTRNKKKLLKLQLDWPMTFIKKIPLSSISEREILALLSLKGKEEVRLEIFFIKGLR